MTKSSKADIQESQYAFPYHYVPHFLREGEPSLVRKLNWGLEYLCYQMHVLELVADMNPKSVLEVGCGDGFFTGHLPASIERRDGVDLSERAIRFAQAFHSGSGCSFSVADAQDVVELYDVVVAIEVIEHVPDEQVSAFLQSVAARVEFGGRLVISAPTTAVPINRKHYRHYTEALLEKQVTESGIPFRLVDVQYVYSKPKWLRVLDVLLSNRYFCLEIKSLTKWAWRVIWDRYRVVSPGEGRHLVAVMSRV